MKRTCKTCKEKLTLEEDFYVCNVVDGKKYYRKECKSCKGKVETKKRKEKFQYINEYKSEKGCERCGFVDNRALQFHHPTDDKFMDVSTMCSHGYSNEKILKEMKKCEVLCANCHAIEHSNY